MFPALVVILWVGSSLVVGIAAKRLGCKMLRWFLISMLFTPLVANIFIISKARQRAADKRAVTENPYAVGVPEHNELSQTISPLPRRYAEERATVPVFVTATQPPPRKRYLNTTKFTAFATVLIVMLLVPTTWYSLSLHAEQNRDLVKPSYELPEEIANLAWEAPSVMTSGKRSVEQEDAERKSTQSAGEDSGPRVEAGRVLHIANVRQGPSTEHPITGLLDQGAIVQLVAQNEEGDWYQLDTGDWLAAFLVARIGQVSLHVVQQPAAQDELVAQNDAATVEVIEAYVRSGPGTMYDIVDSLSQGAIAEISGVSDDGEWYQLADDRWIYAELVNAPASYMVAVPQTKIN